MSTLDLFALAWIGVWSALTFITFGHDKWRAGRGGWRTPEFTLALLGAIGGWPGGLVAMLFFRHKTAQGLFKLKFAIALIPFAAGLWAWQHWR